jgi:iron complex transport system substrate-binding protein
MLMRLFSLVVACVCATQALAGEAKRIISLAPHATELIAAAGGADRLVAVTQSCNVPTAVQSLAKISGASGVNLEKLISLKPDLVVAWPGGNRPQDIERIKGLGIAVLTTEPKTVGDIARDIERIGEAMGTSAIARKASSEMRADARALAASAAPQRKPTRVFYQLGAGHLFTLNNQHPAMELLATCGGENVFGKLPLLAPQVSVEAVVDAKPDVIAVASPRDLTEVTQFWESKRALFGSRFPAIIAADGERLHRPTPRLLPAAKALCTALDDVAKKNVAVKVAS